MYAYIKDVQPQFLIFKTIFIHMYGCFTCIYFCTMYMQWSWRPEEGVGSPLTGATGGCDPCCGCQEQNQDLLEDHSMFLMTEPSLQILDTSFKTNYLIIIGDQEMVWRVKAYASKLDDPWTHRQKEQIAYKVTSDLTDISRSTQTPLYNKQM